MFRSADGKIRVDSGRMSVITDPASKQSVVLDHLTKEAHLSSLPQMPQVPQFGPPGLPDLTPPGPPVNVKDLGKKFIEGHEVDGKMYTFDLPVKPPGFPPAPKIPNLPQGPDPSKITSEVWTSTKLQLPVLTKTAGAFGETIRHCKCSELKESSPELFQIPPDYKTVKMPAPANPPPLPAAPKLPK
ncbi:MAG TPA: hypothetical protein VM120_26415 [Bryobacteraceae bacterium]|nr:hypothetical protein [Bryobacteraceae bacterium]